MMLAAMVVLLIASGRCLADEACNEDSLKQCLHTLEGLLMQQFEGVKKAEKDLTSYCQTLETQGECLKDASKSCIDKFPVISNLVSAFHAYLNQFCTDKGKLYMEMVPCFENHKAEFEKCWEKEKTKRDADSLDDICLEVMSMECVAKVSKEVCKNGDKFGNSLQTYVKKLKSDVCNRGGFVQINFWAIIIAVLFSTIVRVKH